MNDELKKNNNGYNNIIFYIMIFKIDTNEPLLYIQFHGKTLFLIDII